MKTLKKKFFIYQSSQKVSRCIKSMIAIPESRAMLRFHSLPSPSPLSDSEADRSLDAEQNLLGAYADKILLSACRGHVALWPVASSEPVHPLKVGESGV